MTLSMTEGASHPGRPCRTYRNGCDKARTAADDRQLLETMRANPAASASVLAGIVGVGIGLIAGRWRRLAARGLLVKDRRGHWRAVERERPIITQSA